MSLVSHYFLKNNLEVLEILLPKTPVTVINLLFHLGCRHERMNEQGFSHLAEHLHFYSHQKKENYTQTIERIGGKANAFTTLDYTNFYSISPYKSMEELFLLEENRWKNISFTEKQLEREKKTILQELDKNNFEYSKNWEIAHIYEQWFHTHPFKYSQLLKIKQCFTQGSSEEIQSYIHRHYRPDNATLIVISRKSSPNIISALIKKSFEDFVTLDAKKYGEDRQSKSVFSGNYDFSNQNVDVMLKTPPVNIKKNVVFLSCRLPPLSSTEYHILMVVLEYFNSDTQNIYTFFPILKEINVANITIKTTGEWLSSFLFIRGETNDKGEITFWKDRIKHISLNKDISDAVYYSFYQNVKNISKVSRRKLYHLNPLEKIHKIAHWINLQRQHKQEKRHSSNQKSLYIQKTYFLKDDSETLKNQQIRKLLEKVFLQKQFRVLYISKKG